MRKLYLANGDEQFKFADTTTEIRLNAFDDGGLTSLTADAKVRIKNDSGYLLEVSASVTNNQAVITSGQLAQLPAGNYLLELWDTVDGGTAIYPSDGFLRLQINENVTGLSGKLVSSITINDFIRQFSDLSQQLEGELTNAMVNGSIKVGSYATWEAGYISLDGSITQSDHWSHTKEYIPTSLIKGINWPLWNLASCVAYYDYDKKFVSYEMGTGQFISTKYPSTHEVFTDLAKLKKYPYVRFSYNDDAGDMSQYVSFKNITEIFDELSLLAYPRISIATEAGYISLDGSITQSDHWSHTKEYIPTSLIKGINWPLWNLASCVAYYDYDKKFVGYEMGTGDYKETHEVFTDLAKLKKHPYIRFSYNDRAGNMSQYISFRNITEISEVISDLEESLWKMNLKESLWETKNSDWNGRACAFLGDSITDGIGTTKAYWSWLADLIGIKPTKYGINGDQWTGVLNQAHTMKESGNNYDAIFVFAGTNDFHASVQLGDWYAETEESVNWDGTTEKHKRRAFTTDSNTFRGRINNVLSFLKKDYPTKQIILMTPLHRGFATFGDSNVQPDETYANKVGLYISDYVNAVKEAGSIWSVPVIDLFSDSGLLPIYDEYDQYMHISGSDELHPNALGHQRLAQVIAKHLNSIPATLTIG